MVLCRPSLMKLLCKATVSYLIKLIKLNQINLLLFCIQLQGVKWCCPFTSPVQCSISKFYIREIYVSMHFMNICISFLYLLTVPFDNGIDRAHQLKPNWYLIFKIIIIKSPTLRSKSATRGLSSITIATGSK